MTFGEKLQTLRRKHALSQEQLAEQLNVSRQALSKWENGTSMPEADKIILLSEIFHVSTDFLLKDSFEAQPSAEQTPPSTVQKTRLLTISAFALVVSGFLIGWALANDGTHLLYWPASRMVPGLLLQVAGVALAEIAFSPANAAERRTLRAAFYGAGCWFLLALPDLILWQFLCRLPYMYYVDLLLPFCALLTYLAACIPLTCFCIKTVKKHRNENR